MKKSTKIFAILAILLLAALLTVTASAEELPAADAELILQKNFEVLNENGIPEDLWFAGDAWNQWLFVETDPANVFEGNYAVKAVGNSSARGYGYPISVEADTCYEFSFRVKGSLADADTFRTVITMDDAEAVREAVPVQPDSWTVYRNHFKTADTEKLTLLLYLPTSENSIVYFDDIQLRKTGQTDVPQLVAETQIGTSPDNLTAWSDYGPCFMESVYNSDIQYIRLRKNLTELGGAVITGGKFTFDLYGHTLNAGFMTGIEEGAEMTVTDSVGTGLFTCNGNNGYLFYNQGTLIIESGTFHGIIYNNKGTVTITGGRFSEDPSAYVAEGHEVVEDAETGYYVVQKQAAIGPVITVQPVDYSGSVNDAVEFSVAAEGESLRYEWFYSNNGGESWQKSYSSGYNTPVLQVALRMHRDGQQYRCKITDSAGMTVISDAAVMSVRASEVIITSQPATIENGIFNQLYSFSVAAEGENLTYRWQYSSDGGETWLNSWNTGYDTETVQARLYVYRNGYQYRCLVTSGLKNTVITAPAQLLLQKSSVQMVSQSSDVAVPAGEMVEFSVEASGTDLQYVWYRSNDQGGTWIKTYLSGFNSDTLSFIANKNREALFRCVVTDGSGTSVWGKPMKLTLLP